MKRQFYKFILHSDIIFKYLVIHLDLIIYVADLDQNLHRQKRSFRSQDGSEEPRVINVDLDESLSHSQSCNSKNEGAQEPKQ